MVPRNRMTMLPKDADQEQIPRCLLEERRSRIPIYEGTIDNIVGYISAKDLLPLARQRLVVLVDEHGAVSGMVTFEDLAEELVGESSANTRPGAVHRGGGLGRGAGRR